MKITYIHQHFKLPTEGGGSRPYEFARRMADEGHSVTMICGGAEAFTGEVDGILVKRLAVPYRNSMPMSERMRSFIMFSLQASYIVSATKADVIYASSTPLTVAIPAIIGKLVHRVPMIFEVRDLWPSVPIDLGFLKNPLAIFVAKKLEKLAYGSAKTVVALSPGMKDGVLRVTPGKEVVVIPNACDFDLFKSDSESQKVLRDEHGWRENETIVVYAGGFGPTYDLGWAVRVAAQLQKENIKFVLIGEGRDSQRLHNLALSLGLNPKEILVGAKPKPETAKYIQAADIVLSCLNDSSCLEVNSLNKVFDGLAAGKPIIVNHKGWLKDAIVEEGAGWKIDRTIQLAADQIASIAKDRLSLEEASINSSKLGKTRFDRDELYLLLIQTIGNAVKD